MLYKFLTKKFIICSFLSILFLTTGLMAFANYSQKKLSDPSFLKDIVYKQTGLDLSLSNADVKFSLFALNIKANKLSLSEHDKNEPFLNLNNSYVKIKLLPVLAGRISVSEILSDNIMLSVSRLKDGSFDIAKYFQKKKSFFKVDLTKTKVIVLDYNINICDFITYNQFLLDGDKFIADGIDINKKIKINTTGRLAVFNNGLNKLSPYLIDIDYLKKNNKVYLKKQDVVLSSLDLSFLSGYLKEFDFKKLNTKVDIKSNAEKDGFFRFYVYADKLDVAFNYKNELNTLKTDRPVISTIDFDFAGNDLTIKNGGLWADGVKILYSGKIKNILDIKKIEPDLKINIVNTSANKLAKILPDTVIPMKEPYIKNVKKYNIDGIVDGNLDIKFKNSDDFSVKGKLDFTDVYVLERPKNALPAFGSCEFLGREVLVNVFVNAPNNAILSVMGKSQMQKNPVGTFETKSHGKLDLKFAHKILVPVKELLGLKMGPIPYMTMDGTGQIDLKTTGTKEKAKLSGWFYTDDATLTLNGLNAVLKQGKVKVDFDDTKIIFNGAQGLIDNAKVFVDGTSDTDGNMDIKVNVKDVSAKTALNIAKTSPLVLSSLDGGEFLKSFDAKSGNIDFYLNLYGNVPPDAIYGQKSDSVFAKGKIIFKGDAVVIEPSIKGTNLRGELNFENSCDFKLTADIFESPFNIEGKIFQKGSKGRVIHGVPSNLDIKFSSNSIKSLSVSKFIKENIQLFAPQNRTFANYLAKIFEANEFLLKGNVSANGLVKPNATTLDLSGFDFKGSIDGINTKKSKLVFKGGNILLKGKNVNFNGLRILLSNADLLLDGHINKFASQKPFNDLRLTLFSSPFASYADLFSNIMPSKIQNILSNFSEYKGLISGKIRFYGNNLDGEIVPSGISFKDNKTGNIISQKEGKIQFKGDKVYIKNFNLLYGELPLSIDGYIQTNDTVNPEFNIYTSFELTDELCDKIVNPHIKYPLSLSGNIFVKGRIQGKQNSYLTYLTAEIPENSDFSFMGVTLGDKDAKREIASKIKFGGDSAFIDYIRYIKYIKNQNGSVHPEDFLRVSGGVRLLKNDIGFKNFRVRTPNPAPVRLLNVLFKRSILKDGIFDADLLLNGTLSDMKANGNLVFKNVFLPIYDSVIEHINVDLKQKSIIASFKLNLHNTIADFILDIENKLTLPIVINDININSDYVSISNLMEVFTGFADSTSKVLNTPHSSQVQTTTITPSDVQIKKGMLNVNTVVFNGVEAKNLKVHFSHSPKDSSLKIDDSYLGIAGGLFRGSGTYKFDTKDVNMKADFIDCDVNELTKAFFNLSDEIFGKANGSFVLSMKDYTPDDYVQKINASAEFEINKGKMPKLGSIEYLLKASNIVRSGLLGLTLNNVIELLSPYRQGDFNKISGNFLIKNASIEDLKIYSQGDNLSTYTSGTYNIKTGISEIEILGKLSKKVSNLLGPVGNASVVSVLNFITKDKVNDLANTELGKNIGKIPLMGLKADEYRLFNVKLQGEVSKTDAVKSFTWLN